MIRISVLIIGCFIYGSAYSIIPISTSPIYDAQIDLTKMAHSFQDATSNLEKHERAVKELKHLDLNDKKAVMSFAKTYPEQMHELKRAISLKQ